MRGYFGIGIERVSKSGNIGNLLRTAHGFGASFVFTIGAELAGGKDFADTSQTSRNVPLYHVDSADDLVLPKGCALIGIELIDDAVDLPSLRHPQRAAYVLGPERGKLSEALLARCDHVARIPTGFCLNVATAGAIVMYDRLISLGRFAERPVGSLQKPQPLPEHVHGGPFIRGAKKSPEAEGNGGDA